MPFCENSFCTSLVVPFKMHCTANSYNCNVQKMSNYEGVNECTNYIINVMMMQIRGGNWNAHLPMIRN